MRTLSGVPSEREGEGNTGADREEARDRGGERREGLGWVFEGEGPQAAEGLRGAARAEGSEGLQPPQKYESSPGGLSLPGTK